MSFSTSSYADDPDSGKELPPSNSVRETASVPNVLTAIDIRTNPLTKREHPWGTFSPGSWVVRRTMNRSYAGGNILSNVTDTKLTLESVEDNRITLRQESNIGIANRKITQEPQLLCYDFYQQPISNDVTLELFAPQTVTISRRPIVCQVCRYTQVTPEYRKTTTLWYSNQVMPYLLRSEEIRTSVPSEQHPKEEVLSHTVMIVTETSGLRLFRNLLSGDYKTQTVKKSASTTIVTDATCSTNIPGGLLREIAVESDQTGNVISQVDTSVINYFVTCPGNPSFPVRSATESSREIQIDWDITIQGTGGFPK
ncbi:MAG: hypothetical protein FWC50_05715 [Planctomycetaceae bacterium]|nr:hypothetical protein [Planctomycetaceae bacterium]